MAISLTSSLLIVGVTAAQIQIYDIASHQLIRTIPTLKEFSVNALQVMLKPHDLMGHATIGSATSRAGDEVPIRSVTSFQRTRDPKTREKHEVLILLPPHPTVRTPNSPSPVLSVNLNAASRASYPFQRGLVMLTSSKTITSSSNRDHPPPLPPNPLPNHNPNRLPRQHQPE